MDKQRAQTAEQILGWAAAVVCAAAGLYLLDSQSASAQTTVFDSIMHGIGFYFIARALWMASTLVKAKPE